VGVGVAIVCRLSDRLTLGRVGGQAGACSNALFLKATMNPTFVACLAFLMLGLGRRNGLPKRRNPPNGGTPCFTTSPLLCRMAGYATDTVVTLTAVPDESKRCVGGARHLHAGPRTNASMYAISRSGRQPSALGWCRTKPLLRGGTTDLDPGRQGERGYPVLRTAALVSPLVGA
jgi:hypothetical protein